GCGCPAEHPAATGPAPSDRAPRALAPPSAGTGAPSEAAATPPRASSSASAGAGAPRTCAGTKQNVDPLSRLATEAGGSACPPPPRITGTKAAGEACGHPIESAPVCCACATAGRTALASYCRDGRCAPPDDVCCAVEGSVTRSCGG